MVSTAIENRGILALPRFARDRAWRSSFCRLHQLAARACPAEPRPSRVDHGPGVRGGLGDRRGTHPSNNAPGCPAVPCRAIFRPPAHFASCRPPRGSYWQFWPFGHSRPYGGSSHGGRFKVPCLAEIQPRRNCGFPDRLKGPRDRRSHWIRARQRSWQVLRGRAPRSRVRGHRDGPCLLARPGSWGCRRPQGSPLSAPSCTRSPVCGCSIFPNPTHRRRGACRPRGLMRPAPARVAPSVRANRRREARETRQIRFG
jgi:hypothetical protein